MSKKLDRQPLSQYLLLGGLLLLVLGLAHLVFAHGNVDQRSESNPSGSISIRDNLVGQSFVPTVDNLIAVDLYLLSDAPGEVRVGIHEGSPNGPELGFVIRVVDRSGWYHFDFMSPIPLTAGDTYSILVSQTSINIFWVFGSGYPDGVSWSCNAEPCESGSVDYFFRTYYEVLDADGDGVLDGNDFCPATDIPELVPTVTLKPNHWALVDGDTAFDTVVKGKDGGSARSYTTADTAGCSCEQIIAELDLGEGHINYGCSTSVMDEWVESMSP